MSGDGVQTDPDKISKIVNWPTPRSTDEVRSFLCFAGYYRRFVSNFSKLAKPTFHWEDAQENTFQALKQALVSPPVLAYPDYSNHFVVQTDASFMGLRAVLYQIDPDRLILYGNNFTVVIENNPLTYVLTSAKLDATGHRWVSELSSHNFNIKYRPGRLNSDADELSRLPTVLVDSMIYLRNPYVLFAGVSRLQLMLKLCACRPMPSPTLILLMTSLIIVIGGDTKQRTRLLVNFLGL